MSAPQQAKAWDKISFTKVPNGAWGDCLVGRVPAVQTWGPKHKSPATCKTGLPWCVTAPLAPRSWGLNQTKRASSRYAGRDSLSQKLRGRVTEEDTNIHLWPSYHLYCTHLHTCTVHTYTYTWAHECTHTEPEKRDKTCLRSNPSSWMILQDLPNIGGVFKTESCPTVLAWPVMLHGDDTPTSWHKIGAHKRTTMYLLLPGFFKGSYLGFPA